MAAFAWYAGRSTPTLREPGAERQASFLVPSFVRLLSAATRRVVFVIATSAC
jgi:hypothetical protein